MIASFPANMKIALLLLSVWVPFTFCALINFKPEIPSTTLIRGLRTATTVTLAKPICIFASGDVVDVFGVQATASSIPNEIGNGSVNSYRQTRGGEIGPYRAGSFQIPMCTSSQFMASTDPVVIQAEINQYLFRVGNDVQCLNQVDTVPGNCNAPLNGKVPYRFKYAVRNSSTNTVINETLWSDSITLLQVSQPTVIDTWPGKRTGGMVVITTILVILLFLILCAFITLLMYVICMKEECPAMEQQPAPRSYITHQKNEGYAEVLPTGGLKPAAQKSPEQSHYQVVETSSQAPV
ncbi:uroplakin-3a-like [Pristis pectinata]|uniref:uroplakin-3a-like n=1 Tax=Pristis pectinata TaxID=685728 RepID=UPI00223E221E|nr:uroplakin-3a-like [Pristis pectinata]